MSFWRALQKEGDHLTRETLHDRWTEDAQRLYDPDPERETQKPTHMAFDLYRENRGGQTRENCPRPGQTESINTKAPLRRGSFLCLLFAVDK